MECFIADFSRFYRTYVKICLIKHFTDFSETSSSSKMLNLKSLGNSYFHFLLIIIYFRFTCCKGKLGYNLGQRVVNKFQKLSKTGYCMRVLKENVKIWLLGVRLGTRHQIQVFQGFS